MGVRASIEAELAGVPAGWRVELARALADEIDEKASASNVRELRNVMVDITERVAPAVKDLGDELGSRRAARIAAAAGS